MEILLILIFLNKFFIHFDKQIFFKLWSLLEVSFSMSESEIAAFFLIEL